MYYLTHTLFIFERGRTIKAPPPPDSTMIAQNLGLTAQNVESQDALLTRTLSKHCSLLRQVPYTCRNLLCRTRRNDISEIKPKNNKCKNKFNIIYKKHKTNKYNALLFGQLIGPYRR